MIISKRLLILWFSVLLAHSSLAVPSDHCPGYKKGEKKVFWGDLHVHSAYSLDAWGYGTIATPAEAYSFGRGSPLKLSEGTIVKLDRPLDFMAVTDHAEWLNLLYICTDPIWDEDPYCEIMTEKAGQLTGSAVFSEYVIPTITLANPQLTDLCLREPESCRKATKSQWHRMREQTNTANTPCEFTALHGYEWSATPDYSHNHRNIIFRNDQVTEEPIDYLRYPNPLALWQALEDQCSAKKGCEALAIPHNTNMGDGKSFDVETESQEVILLRARYEKLVEIHQEKGSSECLYPFGSTDEDCNFQPYLTLNSVPKPASEFSKTEWEKMRSTYVRSLLSRGLGVYSSRGINPLQMGVIGSTDNHAGTGGFTEEDQWLGSVFGIGDIDRTMTRLHWNPGGILGVWAEENTRSAIFDALKSREVFATSGPRIQVKLEASDNALTCDLNSGTSVRMGGSITTLARAPTFKIQALYDKTPLQKIEVIKGEFKDGQTQEQTISVWQSLSGSLNPCVTWQDPNFSPTAPAFWYARVIESPTLRWSAHHCRREDRCGDFPGAETIIRERAWSSPIWYLP